MKENIWDMGELDAWYVAVGGPWQQMPPGSGVDNKPKPSPSLSDIYPFAVGE